MSDIAWTQPPRFVRDSRGNRLLRWAVRDEPGCHILWLCGPDEVADQVCAAFQAYDRLSLPGAARQQGWTHAVRAPGSVRTDIVDLLRLLTTVITLPSLPTVDTAIALDWYKRAVEGVDPHDWENTDTGELIYQGKYVSRSDAAGQARAGRELVRRIRASVENHPNLARSTLVVDIPGHDSAQVSFGSRLATSVAAALGLPVERTMSRAPFRPPAKSADSVERRNAIMNGFYLRGDLSNHRVLIVDDVYRSGTSMGEVGRAARAAHAARVNGIVAVRTMRAR
jgi:Phosphoribosyl transferase domain